MSGKNLQKKARRSLPKSRDALYVSYVKDRREKITPAQARYCRGNLI